MNKDKLSSWTLAFAAFAILGGLIQINNPEYAPNIWEGVGTFCVGLILAFITWRLRVSVRRDREASAPAPLDAEIVRTVPPSPKPRPTVRANAYVVRQKAYPVAGVTFKNDDGSSRQEILREICGGDDFGSAEAWLEWYQYRGKDAYRVMTEHGCVGNVRKNDIVEVVTAVGASNVDLDVELFETDDGREIYRADLMVDAG